VSKILTLASEKNIKKPNIPQPNLMRLILEYFPALIKCLKLMLMHDFRLLQIITIRNMKIN